MCFFPKSVNISYRSKYFYPSFSAPVVIDAPCGRCESCVNNSRNDYFVRCYSEYRDCINSGGVVPFITLTYDEYKVPYFEYRRTKDGSDIYVVPCSRFSKCSNTFFAFNKLHLQRFFNSLRKHFERLGFASPFRYFVVPEYGSDSAFTQRSHYHLLMFLSPEVSKSFHTNGIFDDSEFLNLCQKYWYYGNISASKKGLLINSFAAIDYTCKYLQKTINLTQLVRFQRFYDFLKRYESVLCPPDYNGSSLDSLFLFYLKKFGCSLFVLKSKNFGLSAISPILDSLRVGDFDDAFSRIRKGFSYLAGDSIKVKPFSNYYLRKLFYDVREDGTMILNYYGLRYREFILDNTISDFQEDLSHIRFDLLSGSHFEPYIDFCKVFSKTNSVLFCLYLRYMRGYSFSQSLLSYYRGCLDSDDYSTNLHSLKYSLIRSRFGFVLDIDSFKVFNDYCIENDVTLSKCIGTPSYSAPLSDCRYELFYQCYKFLRDRSLRSKLQEWEQSSRESRLVRQLNQIS